MKTTFPMVALVVSIAAARPSFAIDVPQTREEFVQAVAFGRGADTEILEVNQSLDRVYAVLEERAVACLDVEVTRTSNVGYVETSSTDYNPSVRRIAADRAEFTLQVAHNPRGVGHTPPPGGLFMMAADLRSIDGGHTEVVLYKPKLGVKAIATSLRQWFAGEPAPCPKLR
jgi:hypothetical protein